MIRQEVSGSGIIATYNLIKTMQLAQSGMEIVVTNWT